MLAQLAQDAADGIIQTRNHREVFAALGAGDVLELFQVAFRRDEWRVHRRERRVEHPRPILMASDERLGFLAERHRVIGRHLDLFRVAVDRHRLAAFAGADAVGQQSVELVEPARVGQILRRLGADVPFADDARGVTELLEMLRERGLREVQALRLFEPFAAPLGVRVEPEPLLVTARHHARAARAAHATADVAVVEPRAVFRQRINVWRADLLVARRTEVRVTEVVGVEDEDVRFGECGGGHKRQAAKNANSTQVAHDGFHDLV